MSQTVNQSSSVRAILDAATSLFASLGFNPVSVSQIATQAGVSKGNLYHHFESKEALYLSVMQEASTVHADYAEALLKQDRSSECKIRDLIEFEILNLLENDARTRLIQREMADRAHLRASSLADDVFDRNFNVVIQLVEQGIKRGEFRKNLNPASAAMLMHGAALLYFQCNQMLRRFPKARKLVDAKAYARTVGSIVVAGMLSGCVMSLTASATGKPAKRSRSVRK